MELTPTSGEPAATVDFEGTDFAASTSAGIGFGAEVEVANEVPDMEDYVVGDFLVVEGTPTNHLIKPSSFIWTYTRAAIPMELWDNGDGTLSDFNGVIDESLINYTTGFFTITTNNVLGPLTNHRLNYTTYEFDVTPSGLAANSSGGLSGQFTVPDIWNGTHTVTFIDSTGNTATATFEVYGSDIIPEPLTIGAIILLTSTSLAVSLHWLRKKPYTKHVVN